MTQVPHWLEGEAEQNFGDYLSEVLLDELFHPLAVGDEIVRIIGSAIDDAFVPGPPGEVPGSAPDLDAGPPSGDHPEANLATRVRAGDETESDGPTRVTFWGCGIRQRGGLSANKRRYARILSVRGPVTAEDLGLEADVPIGDPALLLPALYAPGPDSDYSGRSICVPHFHDNRTDAELQTVSRADIVLRPKIKADRAHALGFIDALTSSEFVLAASLHAAIVAAAYGRPFAFWDPGHIDLPTKWQDFAASVGIDAHFVTDVETGRAVYRSEVEPKIRLPSLWETLAVAPFLIRNEALMKVLRHELADRVDPDTLAELDRRVAVIANQRPHVEALAGRARRQLETGDRERKALRSRLTAAEERRDELRASGDELRAEAQSLRTRVTRVEADRDRLRERVHALERSLPGRAAASWARFAERHPRRARWIRKPLKGAWLAATLQLPRYLRERPERLLRAYFDPEFYLANNPDVASYGGDPFAHYMRIGAREGRSPNGFFHVPGYLFDHPEVAEFADNPLLHYVLVGRRTGATPHPLFDPAWYRDHHAELRSGKVDPYEHYLRDGWTIGRAPSSAVDDHAGIEGGSIALPLGGEDVVTVIIPAFRNFADTYRCLYALAHRTPASLGVRVRLADDCPEQPLGPLLQDFSGLEISVNPRNLGFLRNCNRASEGVQSEFIVFVNNDTVVQAGWLDALVRLARTDPRIGIVGSKLLNTDGTLQEAGGVIFKSGWGHSYGQGDAPGKPEYNFVRQVDCVMGACLMVRREPFEQLGRFDERYAPAFFEEFDLAFQMREIGYDVVYQPESVVQHRGSGSYGAQERDRQSTINHRKFATRWATEIEKGFEGPGDLFRARERPHANGTIVIIEERVPQWDRHAGALTIYQYLRLLVANDFKVIYVPHDHQTREPYTSTLQQLGIEVLYGDLDVDGWFRANGQAIDWVLAARPEVARRYIDLVRRHTSARLLYYTHDLHHLREARRYEVTGDRDALRESVRLRGVETRIFQQVDCVTTPSDDEAALIATISPGTEVRVLLPYFYPERAAEPDANDLPFDQRDAVIFVGGYGHLPNVDAATRLVRDIMPLVWPSAPHARVLLVGSAPPAAIEALESERVEVTGYVPDLEPWYAQARMSVSPLRFGSGVKGKIISSLEAGVPVITTTIGNEGIGLQSGVEALVADTDRDIAAAIVRLFEDPELARSLSDAGRRVVRERFSEQRARTSLFEALHLRVREASVPVPQ